MRKRIVGLHSPQQIGELDQGWLDLEEIATVEVTSEEPGFPGIQRSLLPANFNCPRAPELLRGAYGNIRNQYRIDQHE